ncbi:hypothetical protein JRO89_XS08G0040200 [Xanthoceras sorbifolium]|uniref:glucan endo-1,3-beta-D-glucosidase n=1 Tax=Xanthoceras sorbifolium TaxID=99658 RepID=A0ABQ8HNK7_9ROSI|nr:hypothetical protein JRO89_XS08G0040200 [Xanthoceras sorbifolium]
MARAVFGLWCCWFMVMVLANGLPEVGVNWGNIASHPLPPKTVVQLLKDNGIRKVKLFDSDPKSLMALEGSGMEVMVAIPNLELQNMADSSINADDWVSEYLLDFVDKVKIRYVAVGNEPFLKSYNGSFVKHTFPALRNIQKALEKAGLGKKIKATVPLNADVYESNSSKPSDGQFRPDVKNLMTQIVKFLRDNDSPFVVNIYPFLSLYDNDNFPIEFAFFEKNGHPVDDKGYQYTNVLDANYDTLLWSLKKIGVDDIKIIIGEIGWPTDGHKHATTKNAHKFYDGLFKRLNDNKGTPLRSSAKFDVYLFGLLDEDQKSIAPGFFERHWGIFRFDGQPKFALDITGKGQNKMPLAAKGVEYLEHQWCVFDTSMVEDTRSWMVQKQTEIACQYGDCTTLTPGGSCNSLSNSSHVSYAFNMFYQINNQKASACDFEGLGMIVKKNASQGQCLFPIMIDSGARERLSFGFGGIIAVILMVLFVFM